MFAVKHKNLFLILSGLISLFAIVVLMRYGLKPGIEFTGGSMLEVSYVTAPDNHELESEVGKLDYGAFSLRRAGETASGRQAVQISTRHLNDAERTQLEASVTSLGDGEVERFTSIGPSIGSELAQKSYWAMGAVALIIILYIAYAFMGVGRPVSSWVFGGITLVSLAHDVLLPAAMMSLLGHLLGLEVDVLFITAILAVLGYSVNDTIVVFDRVRENLQLHRVEKKIRVKDSGGVTKEEVTHELTTPFEDVVGQAVSQSVARSINTSMTTMIALACLYFFGGSVTQIFALVLFVGVAAGAYSSLFVAAPLLVEYYQWSQKKGVTKN